MHNANISNIISGTISAGNAVNHTHGITHAGTTYSFEYDEFANRTKTKVGNRTLATYNYASNNGYLQGMTYGNGYTQSYTYDRFGNMAEIKYGNTTVLKNFADSSGAIIRTQDLLTNYEHRVSYDSTGRLISKELLDLSVTGNADKWLHSLEYNFDANNNVTHFAFADKNRSFVTAYEYGKDNLLAKTTLPSGKEVGYTYDNLGRLIGKNLNITTPVENTYTYVNSARGTVDGKTYTTLKLATETLAGSKYKYTYDAYGNITKIADVDANNTETTLYAYVYDEYNQLKTVNDKVNDTYTTYAYDESGNIIRVRVQNMHPTNGYPISVKSDATYTYGDSTWKDLLTSYNGQTITYDAIGNPLNYRDGITLTWQNGRELATFSQTNGASVSYTYDASGMRAGKTVTKDGTTTQFKYVYEGGLLRQMTRGARIYDFSYDANGTPVSMSYRINATTTPTYYYYGTNWRGDVVALYNSSGSITALYEYDAYGNVTVKSTNGQVNTSESHIANINPLRYRGYVYDTETGFYYLQSRYYDPTTCRFINEDIQLNTDSLNGFNTFVYCNNNPIMCCDHTGEAAAWDSGLGGFSPFFMGGGPKYGGGGGGGSSSALAPLAFVAGAGIFACTMVSHQTDGMRGELFLVRAATEVLVKAAEEAMPVYYGADIRGDALCLTTLPMDSATASIWAFNTATTHAYSRNKSWGLYTKDSEDAYAIALFLGGGNLPTKREVHGNGKSGYYYHYHTHGHEFMGYEHFHLWYGNPT